STMQTRSIARSLATTTLLQRALFPLLAFWDRSEARHHALVAVHLERTRAVSAAATAPACEEIGTRSSCPQRDGFPVTEPCGASRRAGDARGTTRNRAAAMQSDGQEAVGRDAGDPDRVRVAGDKVVAVVEEERAVAARGE